MDKKFTDKDFLVDLKTVLTKMQGGLTSEIEKRVERLKNIHEEYKDVAVHAGVWHEQEKERDIEREQKISERQKQYEEAERLAKEYGG